MNKSGIVFNMFCSAANLNSAAIFALHESVTVLAICPVTPNLLIAVKRFLRIVRNAERCEYLCYQQTAKVEVKQNISTYECMCAHRPSRLSR